MAEQRETDPLVSGTDENGKDEGENQNETKEPELQQPEAGAAKTKYQSGEESPEDETTEEEDDDEEEMDEVLEEPDQGVVPASTDSLDRERLEEDRRRKSRYVIVGSFFIFFILVSAIVAILAYFLGVPKSPYEVYDVVAWDLDEETPIIVYPVLPEPTTTEPSTPKQTTEEPTTTSTTTTTTTTTTDPRPRCRYSDSAQRFKQKIIPDSVADLAAECRRCRDEGSAESDPLCRIWCVMNADVKDENSDDNEDPWMVLSRRNFSRKEDCIFGHEAATLDVFHSGFGCDEEVFLGLNKTVNATDPNGNNTDMYEMRVFGQELVGGFDRSVLVKEFFLDADFKINYVETAWPNVWTSQNFLLDSGSGASFCRNDDVNDTNCDTQSIEGVQGYKGGYWRKDPKTTTKDKKDFITLCAGCCNIDHVGLNAVSPTRNEVVTVLFRKKRCEHGNEASKANSYQMKIPPVLECFDEHADIKKTKNHQIVLETKMGKATVKRGKNKHPYWCSKTGVKILERNTDLDFKCPLAPCPEINQCVFNATEDKDWATSAYKDGFGCGKQFFIGTKHVEKLGKNVDSYFSTLHLKIGYEVKGNLKITEERADLKDGMGPEGMDFKLDKKTLNDYGGLLAAAYGPDKKGDPKKNHFCDKDEVKTKCAGHESRWWLMQDSSGKYIKDKNVCFTCCNSKKLVHGIPSWEGRTIKKIEMFIDAPL